MPALLLILLSATALATACQQPLERQAASSDHTGQQLPLGSPNPTGTPPSPSPSPTDTDDEDDSDDDNGDGESQDLSISSSTYRFVAEVRYFAGEYARSNVYVRDQSGSHFELDITFTAMDEGALKKKGTYACSAGRASPNCVWKYPTFIVTLPSGTYEEGNSKSPVNSKHSNPQHYRSGSPYVSGGKLHVELNNMKAGNSFRLMFKVLKTALTSGKLNTSFNLEFKRPKSRTQFDTLQFKNSADETPNEGSFPTE